MLHGGDIYRNDIKLDLSVSVHPLGPPASVLKRLMTTSPSIVNYPDLESKNLVYRLANVIGVKPHQVVLGNGASELFMAIMHAIRPKRVLLPLPSFFGYQWVCGAVGARIQKYYMGAGRGYSLDEGILDKISDSMDMVFLASPNNPTGAYIDSDLLIRIIEKCRECHVLTIVDECFIPLSDYGQDHSLIRLLEKYKNVIVIRAFTKSFALPGVRLGYMVCTNKRLTGLVRRQLPEWNISLPAQIAGETSLWELDHIDEGRKTVLRQRPKLARALGRYGLVYPSNANFLLVKSLLPLFEGLLEQRILIRDCKNFDGLSEGFYRFAIKDEASNEILYEALLKAFGKGE